MPSDGKSDRERLLRLIDGDPSTVKEAEKHKRARESFKKFSDVIYAVKENISRWFKTSIVGTISFIGDLFRGKASLRSLSLAEINRFLIVVLLLFVGYLIIDFSGNTFFQSRKIMALLQSESKSRTNTDVTQLSPLEYYLDLLTSKDIFDSTRVANVAGGLTTLSGLKFVGVDWGEDPTAMIEDANEGRTYFVRQGEKLKNIVIRQILKDRVIFTYEGNLYELK